MERNLEEFPQTCNDLLKRKKQQIHMTGTRIVRKRLRRHMVTSVTHSYSKPLYSTTNQHRNRKLQHTRRIERRFS